MRGFYISQATFSCSPVVYWPYIATEEVVVFVVSIIETVWFFSHLLILNTNDKQCEHILYSPLSIVAHLPLGQASKLSIRANFCFCPSSLMTVVSLVRKRVLGSLVISTDQNSPAF